MKLTLEIELTDQENALTTVTDSLEDVLYTLVGAGVIEDDSDEGWCYTLGTTT